MSANILAIDAKTVNESMEKIKIRKLTAPKNFRGLDLQDVAYVAEISAAQPTFCLELRGCGDGSC